MVGKIHPFSINIRHLPEEPLQQLIWIVWDHYRGGKRWGDPEIIDHCVVCRYVGEWAIDLIWQKWRHRAFVSFGVFINNLTNTDIYDFHMSKVSNEKLKNVIFFCYDRDQTLYKYLDEKFIYKR